MFYNRVTDTYAESKRGKWQSIDNGIPAWYNQIKHKDADQ